MAVLNPPRSLPGLGRALVNFLIAGRGEWDEDKIVAVFKPEGLNDSPSARDGLANTMSALRAIGMLSSSQGNVTVGSTVTAAGSNFSTGEFRRLLQVHVFDLGRDRDPWHIEAGDAHTSGARDLLRALSWMLAQDVLGHPLSWVDNIQPLQISQFRTKSNDRWAITNDTRWTAAARWSLALGVGSPSILKSGGVTPLPVVAIDDVLSEITPDLMPIADFLTLLGTRLPVLQGGPVRSSLVSHLGADPDPGVAEDCVDSSVGQALRILEDRGRLKFDTLADSQGFRLSRSEPGRRTHVTVLHQGKR